jgi:nitrite reductase/ring-hydroxylating ferredoxin subunit/uncharacterized membrane protein
MLAVTRVLERLTSGVERAKALDRPADVAQGLTSRLGPGPVKDALSGTWIGHPLHPVLVTVPIGAFSGAVVLDLFRTEQSAARRLIAFGILSAVPTAAAGLSDWNDTQGAERRLGLAHAGFNVVALGLMTGSWLARRSGGRGQLLALSGLGVIGVSGWLGGHLSYALGVGVDTTAFLEPPTEWTDACAESELSDGAPLAVTVVDTPVLLVRDSGQLRAIGDRCTHRGGPLHEGKLSDGCVECPWHGSIFDLADGSVRRGPASRPAPVFEARVVDGRVQVRRDEESALRLNPTS